MEAVTNLLEIQLDYDKIDEKFVVVRFKSNSRFNVNSKLLDHPNLNMISLSYMRGSYAFAFMDENTYYQLRNIDIGDDVTYERVRSKDIDYFIYDNKEIHINNVLQLLINALANYSKDLNFNNLTGKFYKVYSTTENKIKALEFSIEKMDDNFLLSCKTTKFINTYKFNKSKPNYIFEGNNKTLKRCFDETRKNLYIKQGETGEKASLKFISLRDSSGRAKEMYEIIHLLNEEYKDFLQISFKKLEIYDKIPAMEKKLQQITHNLLKEHKISIVNLINESEYYDDILDFKKNIEKLLSIKVQMLNQPKRNYLNIVFIHDSGYYNIENDPHNTLDRKCATQCIIIDHISQMFDTDLHGEIKLSSALETVLKELLIKMDILSNNFFSYDDWTKYNYQNDWIFISYEKKEDVFYKMTISPDGTYSIKKELKDIFNIEEYDKYLDYFDKNKDSQLLIEDNLGNINIIERTPIITLPSSDALECGVISKARNFMEEYYAGLCDVNYYKLDNIEYYNSGQDLASLKYDLAKASHLYKINCIDGSKSLIKELLQLMAVKFVRLNNITVLPYPIKYLREYIEMERKNNSKNY